MQKNVTVGSVLYIGFICIGERMFMLFGLSLV